MRLAGNKEQKNGETLEAVTSRCPPPRQENPSVSLVLWWVRVIYSKQINF